MAKTEQQEPRPRELIIGTLLTKSAMKQDV